MKSTIAKCVPFPVCDESALGGTLKVLAHQRLSWRVMISMVGYPCCVSFPV